jgi:hypothetical protein
MIDREAIIAAEAELRILAVRAQAPHPHLEQCQSQPISTRAASRHRRATNGFRCRFVASEIVLVYDRAGA